jgi:hypothetical protein
MGWGDVRYCFAMAILVIILILPHIFVRSISRRCLDQTLWNLVGISSCWCCSYQVSSISVQRVTCYYHLCVFHFFSILAVSMETATFWKNRPLPAQLHMAYDIPTRFHKVWSRHLREIERTKMCGRIRIRIIVSILYNLSLVLGII